MFTNPIVELNRELAEKIDSEVKANPLHPYSGKFVGIANGKVVSVAESVDEVCDSLEQIEPDNTRTYVLEIGADYSRTESIWETR